MVSKEISREDLLVVLASMGATLPPNTKLPQEDLSKRLTSGLDASQGIGSLLATPVDLDPLPRWVLGTEKTLSYACQRGNMTELWTREMDQGKKGHDAPKSDTFKEMRQTVHQVGMAIDAGCRQVSLLGPRGKSGIAIRILEVYKIKDEVPLFYLEFKDIVPTAKESLEVLVRSFFGPSNIVAVNISHLEYLAILKLFKRNASKLADKHRDEASGPNTKKVSTKSFLLPLCALNQQTLGKLTSNIGCEVCGDKMASKCAQCMSVAYCGKECQRVDWSNHKATCKSLKGGSWHAINVSSQPGGKPAGLMEHRTVLNRLDPISTLSGKYSAVGKDDSPDIRNSKIFLAKFQAPMFGGTDPHIMIYDRQRSFQSFWQRSSAAATFDEAINRMGGYPKFYRWVRWVGEKRLEVCLDRAPPTDPVW